MSAAPLVVSVRDASVMLGCGRTTITKLIASGELRSVRVAGRRLILRASVFELLGEKDVAA